MIPLKKNRHGFYIFNSCKEIDIAAALEHVRDQRGGMVQTRQQFEFCLMAVAEEVKNNYTQEFYENIKFYLLIYVDMISIFLKIRYVEKNI